jgi:hypothetical protein
MLVLTVPSPPPTHPHSPAMPPLQIANELIEGAKSQLAGYDRMKAAPLLALAEYIRSRKN